MKATHRVFWGQCFSALVWLACLLIAQLALHELGNSTYALPAFNADALRSWVTNTNTTTVVLSLVHVATMIAIWYVLATTIICAIAHRSSWQRLAAIADRVTLPAARVLAVRLAGISAITGLAMPVAMAHAAPTQETPVLHHLLPNEPLPTLQSTITTTSTTVATPTPASRQHTVQRGENFWTIAQDTLTTSLKRNPLEKEVTDYWRALVRANQQKLAQPTNPDLLFAGQVIDLPEIP